MIMVPYASCHADANYLLGGKKKLETRMQSTVDLTVEQHRERGASGRREVLKNEEGVGWLLSLTFSSSLRRFFQEVEVLVFWTF